MKGFEPERLRTGVLKKPLNPTSHGSCLGWATFKLQGLDALKPQTALKLAPSSNSLRASSFFASGTADSAVFSGIHDKVS